MPGFPASGKQIRMSGATVYFFDGERISGHWQITDRLGVYQQLRQANQGN
jgi:predicted ester cyclase